MAAVLSPEEAIRCPEAHPEEWGALFRDRASVGSGALPIRNSIRGWTRCASCSAIDS